MLGRIRTEGLLEIARVRHWQLEVLEIGDHLCNLGQRRCLRQVAPITVADLVGVE